MGIFRRKKVDTPKSDELTIPLTSITPTENESLIEIVAHQDAKKEIIEEAKAVNAKLKQLLVDNGFHVRIYLAAGHTPTKSKGKKKND